MTAAAKSEKKSAHPLRDNIEVVVFAVVMALGLKVFAIEAYQIPTGSMQPTLMGTGLLDATTQVPSGAVHDRVLVDKLSYLLRDPERWEVLVFRYPLVTHNNYVKRCVGLPGEWLKIEEGDLYAHPAGEPEWHILRKPLKLQETLWKRVFPTPLQSGRPWRSWQGSGGWSAADDRRGLLRGRATLEFGRSVRDDYRDGYPDAIRNRVPAVGAGATSRNVVSDLKIETRVEAGPGAAPLNLRMDCGAFVLELELPANAGGSAALRLPGGFLLEHEIAAYSGPLEVSLAFWDHTAHLLVEGSFGRWEELRELELEPRPIPRNRIAFATTAGEWWIGLPSLYRDIHYLPPIHGGTPLFEIPEGEYFMMGDNTQNSLDSRDFTARELDLDPPVDGRTHLRGDDMESGHDPANGVLANPRWNRDRSLMTFRDEFGGVFVIPRENIVGDHKVPAHTVPRENIIGKAIFVFLPVPPFSPVFRVRAIL